MFIASAPDLKVKEKNFRFLEFEKTVGKKFHFRLSIKISKTLRLKKLFSSIRKIKTGGRGSNTNHSIFFVHRLMGSLLSFLSIFLLQKL